MAKMLNLSIDVTKIDKSKLIKGEKGTYLNLTVSVNDEKDTYGNDVSAWQGQDQAERDNKAPKQYLGNGRVFWSGDSKPQNNTPTQQVSQSNAADFDDLPF